MLEEIRTKAGCRQAYYCKFSTLRHCNLVTNQIGVLVIVAMATKCEAATTYANLRVAATAAKAKVVAAEAMAAVARASVEARVAAAQAATLAMCTHACHAFFNSPHFNLLDARGSIRLVTDAVHEDDTLCLALTCRAFRDALWARFPRRPVGDAHVRAFREYRLRTRDVAVVGTVGRFAWARGLDHDHLAKTPWLEWSQDRICETAAQHGALASLQWARANNCNWDAGTCEAAAWGGHTAVLQWARANGCDWNEQTCAKAANGGHLGLLQWARANGCEWDANTCSNAAKGGHLAVLQWARANGCEWDVDTCIAAAIGGHVAVLQWARANDCDCWNEDED